MSYLVIKKIKGKPYLYRQTSKRVGDKVNTTSSYIGALSPQNRTKVNTTKKVDSALGRSSFDRIIAAADLIFIVGGMVWSAHSPTSFLNEFNRQISHFNKFQKQETLKKIKNTIGDLSREEKIFFSALTRDEEN